MSKLSEDLISARRAGIPIIAIETADPAACIRQVRLSFTGAPLVSWDKADGLKAQNTEGEAMLTRALGESNDDGTYPIDEITKALRTGLKFPSKTILFIMNGHKYLETSYLPEQPANCQALWNVRDEFKKDKRMVIILCPSIKLPVELKHDIVVLEDPLPGPDELAAIIRGVYKQAQLKEPTEEVVKKGVESVKGLSSFEAEQVTAMSIEKSGLNLERLWLKKQKSIESSGLTIWKEKITFDDVRGVKQLKEFQTLVFNGQDRPTVGVFWDELEKMMAGTQGDLSGTSQEMHGQTLSWMADNNVPAMRYVGHPGCSKSYISKAVAGQFEIPLIIMNISELKGSLVGQSTENLKNALRLITAIGRPLVMATCNNEEDLSPELRDRFNLGTWFFDLPNEEELLAVFDIWMSKFKLKCPLPSDHKDWTPRNVHDCCSLAWRLKIDLESASKFIVPVIKSNPERIDALRKKADGKYLSVSQAGVYRSPSQKKLRDDTIRSIDVSHGIGEA